MSEISNILTSSNNIIYSKVNITQPVNGVNYFNNSYTLVKSQHWNKTMNDNEITINDTSISNESHILLCHVHGSIKKDLSKGITYYSINNQPMNTQESWKINETIAFPANPNSDIDYFDYIYIPPTNFVKIVYYIKTHNNYGRIYKSGVELDLTVDYYCL